MSASEEQHKLHFPLCGTGPCTVATRSSQSRKKSLTAAAMFGLAGLAAAAGTAAATTAGTVATPSAHVASGQTGALSAPGVSAQHNHPADAWKANYELGGVTAPHLTHLQELSRGYSREMPTPAPFGPGFNTTTTMPVTKWKYETDQSQKDVTQITNETTDIVQASSDLQKNATLLKESQTAETNVVVESALELERNSTKLCQKMVEFNINATELQIKNKYEVTDEQIQKLGEDIKVNFDDVDTNVSEQVKQGLAKVEKRNITKPEPKPLQAETRVDPLLQTHAPSATFKTLMSHWKVQKAALKKMCSASSASCTSKASLDELQHNVNEGIKKTDIRPPEEASDTDKAVQNIKAASVLLYRMLTCSGLC